MEKGTLIPIKEVTCSSELGHGYVRFVDIMGDEAAIDQAARTSYGDGTRSVSDMVTLIRYLMRHRHTTPFEMVELKFEIYCPMDMWRQMIRHRTASVNEYSTRYSEAIDDRTVTPSDGWRLQATSNKQGSSGVLEDTDVWPVGSIINVNGYRQATKIKMSTPDVQKVWQLSDNGNLVSYEQLRELVTVDWVTPGEYLTSREQTVQRQILDCYNERLQFGVAREQARKDLPLSTFTKAFWKIDLHNLLHFLSLRMDKHAQVEIRAYANALGSVVEALLPNVWQAFLDYRINAVTLTALDIKALREGKEVFTNKRERDEFLSKLERLGLDLRS